MLEKIHDLKARFLGLTTTWKVCTGIALLFACFNAGIGQWAWAAIDAGVALMNLHLAGFFSRRTDR